MKHFLRRFMQTACIILVAALLSSCQTLLSREEATPPPLIPRVEISYVTMVVEAGIMEKTFSFNGFVRGIRTDDIYIDIPEAVLVEYYAKKDDRVSEGDILAVFTIEDLDKQVTVLERALEIAQINYNAAVRTNETANTNYQRLLDKSERDRQLAEDAYAEAQLSYEFDLISASELRRAENTYLDTIAQIEQNLETARMTATNSDSVLRESINLQIARENLEELEGKIEKFVLRAPYDGVITEAETLKEGNTYSSSDLLYTIVDDSYLYICVLMSDSDLQNGHPLDEGVQVDMTASVRNDDGDRVQIEFTGIVVTLPEKDMSAAMISKNMVVVEVRDWPEGMYVGGPRATASITEYGDPDVVIIPLNALNRTGDYTYVRIMEDGYTRERMVITGTVSSNQIEILEGLEPGDEIVIR